MSRLGKKLVVRFLIIAIIMACTSAINMGLNGVIQRNYHQILTQKNDFERLLTGFVVNLNSVENNAHSAITASSASARATAQDLFEEYAAEVDSALSAMNAAMDPELGLSSEKLPEILSEWETYSTTARSIISEYENAETVDLRVVHDRILNELQTHSNNIFVLADGLVDDLLASTAAAESNIVKLSRIVLIVNIALVVVAFVIAIALGRWYSSTISKGITNCIDRIKALAEGDLNTPVELIYSKDEIEELSQATQFITKRLSTIVSDEEYLLSEMAKGNFVLQTKCEDCYTGDFRPLLLSMRGINRNLNNMLSQIKQASEQVATSSEQVANGSQALSQGATEQASSVQELAATINDISQQISGNAEHTKFVNEKIHEISLEVDDSKQKMDQLIEAMNEITTSSSEIGKIIKTIEDIAFQTNILALNAAVEAARAGAAGKGFAVVADEVRNLASKSAAASKNTASLIENSIKAVEHGSKIASDTASALGNIVDNKEEIREIVEKISEASTEQANSISQITLGIDQISSVVQTNSATAQESAAASQELSGQATVLEELFNKFHFREEGDGNITASNNLNDSSFHSSGTSSNMNLNNTAFSPQSGSKY